MDKIINLNDYKSKVYLLSYSKEDILNFEKEMEIYDEFYDYYGQYYYNRIQNDENISEEEWLENWGVHNAKEFLDCWRGNSDEEYRRWRKENEHDRYS